MELTKKKYLKNEVIELLNKNNADYEAELLKKNDRIEVLREENRKLSIEIDNLKKKDDLVVNALIKAEEKEKETEALINVKYELEMKKLKFFTLKWKNYFDYLQEKYPYYKINGEIEELKKSVNDIFGAEGTDREKIEKLSAVIKEEAAATENKPFNPKEKIEAYINAEGGLDMNEVLNPGELDLEDLCKELGLMDR